MKNCSGPMQVETAWVSVLQTEDRHRKVYRGHGTDFLWAEVTAVGRFTVKNCDRFGFVQSSPVVVLSHTHTHAHTITDMKGLCTDTRVASNLGNVLFLPAQLRLTKEELNGEFSLEDIPFWRCQPYVRPRYCDWHAWN